MPIHPTALVDPRAEIHETVEVGPYAIIQGPVRIGPRTRIMPYAHISGQTVIGEDNVIHMGAVIGHAPQIKPHDEAPRRLVIGNRNILREYFSVHCASKDEGETRIGDDCFLMGFSHVAHDCRIGNDIILVNGALVAGHVEIQDGAFISGNCVVHQFVRIGRYAMFQGLSGANQDIPPFMLVVSRSEIAGINVVGLRRAGFSAQDRNEIKRAFKVLFRQGLSLPSALEHLRAGDFGPAVREIVAFCENPSKRGICTTYAGGAEAEE